TKYYSPAPPFFLLNSIIWKIHLNNATFLNDPAFVNSPLLWQLLALGIGLLSGALIVSLFYRRVQGAALERVAREHEARQVAAQNQWMLREQSMQHELTQTRQQLEELRTAYAQIQQHLTSQTNNLNDTQQLLAAAREKLLYLDEIKQQLRIAEQEVSDSRRQQADLNARLEGERKSFDEQLTLLKNAKVELGKEFENLANKIFDTKQQQLSLSSKTLLDTTLEPLKLE